MGRNGQYPRKASAPATLSLFGRAVGDTNAVTAVAATTDGWTIAYTSTGIYTVTVTHQAAKDGATLISARGWVNATTQGDVKSFVVVPGTYSTTAYTLAFHLFESGSLANLAALEWFNFELVFRCAGQH